MFIGEYQHNLDEKGRLAIPVKFREILKKGTVVTKGLDSCLFVYTKEEWSKLAEKLSQLPISKANTRAFGRLMLAGAMEVEMDKQGRVVMPDYLRKYAGISKKVILAGLFNRIEIWDEQAWEKYKTGTEGSSADIAEALEGLGV
ncbi:MAG: division/cell wall cluster transcriptional repressor MraZ [Candidatus Buchananbacteria bacterium]